ncbi:MAG TPA: GNAT family N-acetyltransferase [Geobacteraceae bacterium]|nr:GNAT family N-acetyltransferase [Geobacteraceae bacterium]
MARTGSSRQIISIEERTGNALRNRRYRDCPDTVILEHRYDLRKTQHISERFDISPRLTELCPLSDYLSIRHAVWDAPSTESDAGCDLEGYSLLPIDRVMLSMREKLHLMNIDYVRIYSIDDIRLAMNMSERVDNNYKRENGILKLFPLTIDIPDWSEGNRRKRLSEYRMILENNGLVMGAYNDATLVGIASLKTERLSQERMQLFSLHVDASYRGMGIGRELFSRMIDAAKSRNARGLYISAAPKEKTVDFYLRNGCKPATIIEPELLRREPADIHMEIFW